MVCARPNQFSAFYLTKDAFTNASSFKGEAFFLIRYLQGTIQCMECDVSTLDNLEGAAKKMLDTLRPRASGATLITLSGELGAGKTAFVKALAKELGVSGVVNSPTFVLEKIYLLPEGGKFVRLVHIDAYRLGNGKELAPLGFEALMEDEQNIIALEWPERVADALPVPALRITLTLQSGGSRTLSYE